MKKIVCLILLITCLNNTYAQEVFYKEDIKIKYSYNYTPITNDSTEHSKKNDTIPNDEELYFNIAAKQRKDMFNGESIEITIKLKGINEKIDDAKGDLRIMQMVNSMTHNNNETLISTDKYLGSVKYLLDWQNTKFHSVIYVTDLSKQEELFKSKFKTGIKEIIEKYCKIEHQGFDIKVKDNEQIMNSLMLGILISFTKREKNDFPIAGYMKVYKHTSIIDISNNIDKNTRNIKKRFDVDMTDIPKELNIAFNVSYVELEILEGEINNLIIIGRESDNSDKVITFTNVHSIPFSSKVHYTRLDNCIIYNTDYSRSNKYYRLSLSQIIEYTPATSIHSMDYSPEDGTYKIYFDDDNEVEERRFHKEDVSELLKVKIYTDLLGLLGTDNPNGLVQTEFSKKIFLRNNRSHAGYLKFLEFNFTLSKIEENERYLEVNNDTTTDFYSETLDIFKYSNYNFGLNVNLFNVKIPYFKTIFEVNMGGSIYNTPFSHESSTGVDTITSEAVSVRSTYSERSLSVNPNVMFKFKPSPVWGIDIGLTGIWFTMQETLIRQFPKNNNWIITPQIKGNVYPAKNNELYLRIAYYQATYNTDNYVQLQFGYAYKFNAPTKSK